MNETPSPRARFFFATLLSICFLLRLRFGRGLTGVDDFAYVNAALEINEHGLLEFLRSGVTDIYANRLSLVLPLAASQALFGPSELAVQVLGLCFAFGSVALAFMFARHLQGERAGWLAALLIASIPQEITLSTSLIPDVAMPLYAGLAMYCTVRAQAHALGRTGLLWYTAAGFATLCAFQARATSGMVLLVLGCYGLLQARHRVLRAALPGITFVAQALALWGVLWLVSGDPRLQLRQWVMDGTGTPWTATGKPFSHLFWMLPIVRALVDASALLHSPRPLTLTDLSTYVANPLLGLHYYLTWAAAILAVTRLRSWRNLRYPLLGFLILYAFFEFGSTSLTRYLPIWKYERFLTVMSVPSAVLSGMVLAALPARAWERAWVRMLAPSAAALYIAISAAALLITERHWGNRIEAEVQTMARLKRLDTPQTWYFTGPGWAYRAQVMVRQRPVQSKSVRDLDQMKVADIHDAIVVLDRSFFEPWSSTYYDKPGNLDPELSATTQGPAGWRLLFEQPVLSLERKAALVQVFQVP